MMMMMTEGEHLDDNHCWIVDNHCYYDDDDYDHRSLTDDEVDDDY